MTHVACPYCGLRFTAAYVAACPECGRPPQLFVGPQDVVGFRLFVAEDLPLPIPEAVAVSMPLPDGGEDRS
jgi:hypothetical protein